MSFFDKFKKKKDVKAESCDKCDSEKGSDDCKGCKNNE